MSFKRRPSYLQKDHPDERWTEATVISFKCEHCKQVTKEMPIPAVAFARTHVICPKCKGKVLV